MKLVKKLLIALGILILLILIGGLLLPVFIDVNDYKDKIEQLAEENTGRKLTLQGDLELKTFPTLRIKTGALTIANPDGFPHQNMLEINSAEIGIRVLPLLLKKVEAGTIKFDTPVINLTKKSTGEANWEFKQDETQEDKADQSDSKSTLAAIAVQGFEISKATLNYADLTSDTLVNVSDLNVSTGSIIPGSSFPVEITAAINGSFLAEPVQLSLNSQAVIDSAVENIELTELSSVVNQAESSYEINLPKLHYALADSRLAADSLNLSTDLDAQSKAQLAVNGIEFDLDQLVANLANTKANYISGELNANVDLANIKFDANNQSALLGGVKLDLKNPDVNAQLNLPETAVDLTQSEYTLGNLAGVYQFKNLSGELSVPEVTFNKDKMEFIAKDIQTKFADSALSAQLSGGLSPLAVNYKVNTQNLNIKQTLSALEADFETTAASALTELSLDLAGNYTESELSVDQFSGKLDATSFDGNASITDFSNPVYKLNLNLGELALDDYLPKTAQENTSAAGETTAAAAGAPVALSQFNVTADIKAKRIYSQTNGISLENLQLGLVPANDNSSISFTGLVSGDALPEPVNLRIGTLAKIDTEKSTAQLADLKLSANGQTINAAISVPQASLPFSAENISLENISADFSNAAASAELSIPSFDYNSDASSLVIKDVSGKGRFNDMNASILLPNLSVALDNQNLKLNELSLDLSGTKPVGRVSVPTLEMSIANLTMGPTNIIFEGQDGRAELNLKPGDGSGNYSGNLIANDFNLRGILNRFDLLTDLDDQTALTRVNIQSPIQFSQSKLKLENIKASIDDTSISGFVDATLGSRPVYNFSINIGQLNADRYIPAAAEGESSGSTKAIAAPVAIPVELFQDTTADGKLHFDRLEIGGAQFNDFNIGVIAKQGKLSISPIESGFFNGQMNGNLAIDSAPGTPRLDFDYALSQVALEPALSSLGVTNKLAGSGNFSLKMGASGKTDRAMISSVGGNASLDVNNGTLKGVNIQDILFKGYQTYAALKNKTVNTKYNPADQTEFSSMTGNWTINNGIVSGDDLQIMAPLFRINGSGKVSLIDNTIDYLLNIKVVKSLEGQGGSSMKELEGRTIPMSITGSLTDPQYQLDVSALVKAEVQRKAEEKIEEKIEEKLGEKLEGEGSLREKLEKKAVEKVGEKLLDLFN